MSKRSSEIDGTLNECQVCSAAMIDEDMSANEYELAVDTLTDQLIAGAFAMTSKRGQEEMNGIITDMGAVHWNTIAIETMLFFHHIVERYAEGIFGQEISVLIMKDIDPPLIGKFAKAGSVGDDNMDAFHKMYIHNLEQRRTEYTNYELGNVIDEEITYGTDGNILDYKERTEKFASIFISEDDISETHYDASEDFKTQLLWHFSKKIAELMGEPDSIKVTTYVYRYIIAFLFFTFNPVKELNSLKSLLDTNDAVQY